MDEPKKSDGLVERTERINQLSWRWSLGIIGASILSIIITSPLRRFYGLRTWLIVLMAVNIVLVVAVIALGIWQVLKTPRWNRQMALQHADRLQRRRRSGTIAYVGLAAVGLVTAHVVSTLRHPPIFTWIATLVIGISVALYAFRTVGGWRVFNTDYTNLADDELTISFRAKAMGVGYGVLFLGVGIGLPLSMAWPSATLVIFSVVLWLGLAVPALSLLWLEYRAEQGG